MATTWTPNLIAFIIRNPKKMNNGYVIHRMVGALIKSNIAMTSNEREWLSKVYETANKNGKEIPPLMLISTQPILLNYVNDLYQIACHNLQTV